MKFRWAPIAIIMVLFLDSNAGPPESSAERNFTAMRADMLRAVAADVAANSHVLGRTTLSAGVCLALETVPRHLFVPPELRGNAYANHPLPIGHGQTISQPTIVAMMTDLLALSPRDTVLEIGTGSGYQAAVLAEVVPWGFVHTVEIVPELARAAARRLADLGYHNVAVHEGDGYLGLPEAAPFPAIMVTAAAPDIPAPLLEQLACGGRLVMPVGPHGDTQWLTLVTKDRLGNTDQQAVLPVRFVPLVRSAEDP